MVPERARIITGRMKNMPYVVKNMEAIVKTHMDKHELIFALSVIAPVSINTRIGPPNNLF